LSIVIDMSNFYNVTTMNKIFPTFLFLLISLPFIGCSPVLEFNDQIAREFSTANDQADIVKDEAKALLEQKKKNLTETDLVQGPCLGMVNDNWVVDIAHNPRTPEDEQPANQCQEYYDGRATHFIEISPDGQILKVQ